MGEASTGVVDDVVEGSDVVVVEEEDSGVAVLEGTAVGVSLRDMDDIILTICSIVSAIV